MKDRPKPLFIPTVVKPVKAYTLAEAVVATGIGRTTLYEEIKAGRLKARKRGRSTIILTEHLEEYLNDLPPA